ncbi:hypothetical protein M0804_008556 [Polistes exclamans]|nr:hypothetical protein M0804_008556 [Polistes exclamans]
MVGSGSDGGGGCGGGWCYQTDRILATENSKSNKVTNRAVQHDEEEEEVEVEGELDDDHSRRKECDISSLPPQPFPPQPSPPPPQPPPPPPTSRFFTKTSLSEQSDPGLR